MQSVYVYAVSYDLGFAPNPFGGLCSVACCKPKIRHGAKLGDWIIGLTGTRLPPALRFVFAMKVTATTSFDGYWGDPNYAGRKAKRNGSQKTQVGDNIYHRDSERGAWVQEDSVHSLPGGAQCPLNTAHDTRVNRVLLSDAFVYFGEAAPVIPPALLRRIGYRKNARDFRRFELGEAAELIEWVEGRIADHPNEVVGDPINFDATAKNFSYKSKKLI